MLTVRPACMADIDILAETMRPEDREEVFIYSGRDPKESLLHCFGSSHQCFSAFWEGQLIAMFGCATQDYWGNVGSPWLLGTGEFHKFSKDFLIVSEAYISHFLSMHSKLTVDVLNANKKSLKWLMFNGFEATNFDVINGHAFITMTLENKT